MRNLPPILYRDYLRQIVWPHVQLFGCVLVLGLILIGLLP